MKAHDKRVVCLDEHRRTSRTASDPPHTPEQTREYNIACDALEDVTIDVLESAAAFVEALKKRKRTQS